MSPSARGAAGPRGCGGGRAPGTWAVRRSIPARPRFPVGETAPTCRACLPRRPRECASARVAIWTAAHRCRTDYRCETGPTTAVADRTGRTIAQAGRTDADGGDELRSARLLGKRRLAPDSCGPRSTGAAWILQRSRDARALPVDGTTSSRTPLAAKAVIDLVAGLWATPGCLLISNQVQQAPNAHSPTRTYESLTSQCGAAAP